MENVMNDLYGADMIDKLVQSAEDEQKRKYLDRVWAMSKIDMFKELMRVHGESTKMMLQAQAEIDNLKAVIAQYNEVKH
jgi:hypothetical protein